MLTIRKEQMEVLDRYALERFERQMVQRLVATFPDRTAALRESELRGLVAAGIRRAAEYGIVMEPDVHRFLECVVVYGVQFGRTPETRWAGEILENPRLNSESKMDRIDDYELFSAMRSR